MSAMEPGEAIGLVETDLRNLVLEVLGPEWLAKSKCDPAVLKERVEAEVKRRPGGVVDRNLIGYTEFYELGEIIECNWTDFAPVWRSKQYFKAVFSRLSDFRNPDAHNRSLLPFEVALVEGWAGEIRNTVTLYRSGKSVDMEYYPLAESVTDSFGTVAGIKPSGVHNTGEVVPIRLGVGDTVQFACRGWDPQGRDITWTLIRIGRGEIDRQVGTAVTLTWAVEEADVGESCAVLIYMTGSGKYHRLNAEGHDLTHVMQYSVNPPRDA